MSLGESVIVVASSVRDNVSPGCSDFLVCDLATATGSKDLAVAHFNFNVAVASHAVGSLDLALLTILVLASVTRVRVHKAIAVKAAGFANCLRVIIVFIMTWSDTPRCPNIDARQLVSSRRPWLSDNLTKLVEWNLWIKLWHRKVTLFEDIELCFV